MKRLFSFTLVPLMIVLLWPGSAVAAKPLSGKVIALDAGHGGSDPGAVNENPAHAINEKDMDITVVNLLKKKLEKNSAAVILTRTGDETVGLRERVDRANASNAQILVSVHHNSASAGVNGTESYFTDADDQALAGAVNARLVNGLGTSDRGVRPMSDFVMTKYPNMPSTITEGSFVTDDVEAHAFRFGRRAQQEANALHKGLIDYFSSVTYK